VFEYYYLFFFEEKKRKYEFAFIEREIEIFSVIHIIFGF